MGELCILIPTFEKYRTVAAFTRSRLDRHWPDHPRVFFCGLEGDSPDFLPLREDPANWMKLVRSAVDELLARGFDRCYLVLDDHPPLADCHAEHLNRTLPRFLDELSASFINLQGWGQYRPQQGEDLGPRYFHLERPAREYLWKFALHPGLWRLLALREILDVLLRDPDPKEHTCWKFERRAGDQAFPLPSHLQGTAYRICGTAMTARPMAVVLTFFRRIELFALDVLRFFVRTLFGQGARDRFDARYLGLYHFYDGPYPMFWSGLMKKGRLNPDLMFFLKFHRRHELLSEIRTGLELPESAG